MPRPEDGIVDPGIVAALDAVDATLAGEPVDPAHAELAELALLLADERPSVDPRFGERLDHAVARRFVRSDPALSRQSARFVPALRRRWWAWTPAGGLAAALIAAIVIVAAGETSHRATVNASVNGSAAKVPSPTASAGAGAPASAGASSSAASSAPSASSPPSAAGALSPALQPPSSGRKIIQSAQIALTAAPRRIEQVAQEVFAVIGQVRGIVSSSTVTASSGADGYAQFQLSIPSSELPQAMASLSSLRYARVASRTDTTQDINNQYQSATRALADARALRTSLLKQLANATTQAQISSLTARIHDAEASISSDEATLRGLNRQINYSQVTLTINGGPVPAPVTAGHSGFGIGRAAHDAARVLTVAAGIALVAAAVLVPLALLGALAWWIASALRRRRREQALDLV